MRAGIFISCETDSEDGRAKNGCDMPKRKTRKAAAKRFKRTAKGTIQYSKAGAGHLLTGKSRKRKRGLRGRSVLSKVEEKRISPLLGG